MSLRRRLAASGGLRRPNFRGAGGRVPGFVPTDLSGIIAWFRLDEDNRTLNSGNVSGLTDLSGNGNDASQNDPAAQPLWNSSDADFGGEASMSLDGSSEYMFANGVSSFLSGNADQPWTVIAAIKQTSNGAQFSWGSSSSDTPFIYCFLDSVPDMRIQKRDDAGTLRDQSSGPLSYPVTDVMQWVSTGTTISTYVGTTQHLNGANTNTDALTVDQFALGALYRTTVGNFMSGKMADIVVYNRALSDSERADVRGYMVDRYSL